MIRKACLIEPSIDPRDGTSGGVLVTARHNIRSKAACTEAQSCKRVADTIANFHRKASLQGGNPIKAPTGHDFVGSTTNVIEELLAFPKWQVERVADD